MAFSMVGRRTDTGLHHTYPFPPQVARDKHGLHFHFFESIFELFYASVNWFIILLFGESDRVLIDVATFAIIELPGLKTTG